MLGIVFAAAAASLLGSCIDTEPASCTLVGCGSVAEMELYATPDSAELADGSVRVCINARCVTSETPAQPSSGVIVGTPALRVGVTLMPADGGAGVLLTASIEDAAMVLADGDVYTAEVLDATGVVLASRTWTAQYGEDFPNGEDCGPACQVATLTALPE